MKLQKRIVPFFIIFLLLITSGCKKDVPEPEYLLNVNVLPSGSGMVNMAPGGGKYIAGTEVNLSPTPNGMYKFEKWSGPDSPDIIDNKIVISKDVKITANFFRFKAGTWIDYYSDNRVLVEFNFKDDRITDAGSTVLYSSIQCCFIVHLYFGTVPVTLAYTGNIEVDEAGSFLFATEDGLLVNGTFTSSEYCEGSIMYATDTAGAFFSFSAQPQI